MRVTCERASVREGVGKGIKGSWKSRRRKRGGKRPNSFLSVVRFNFPRFASEPFNALQPAPLPIHFLVPFPISAAIKGPRCRSRICEEIDRASIRSISQPIVSWRELQKRSVRNTLITQRCINLRADSFIKRKENRK